MAATGNDPLPQELPLAVLGDLMTFIDEKIEAQAGLTPIQISRETHRMVKNHCDKHGLKLGQWADRILREFLTGKLARVSPVIDVEELRKQ